MIKRLRTPGYSESERLKDTALNLLHPTASLLFEKFGFSLVRHSLLAGGDKGEGENLVTQA